MSGDKRKEYVADFETTTRVDDCRVWGWGLANIHTAETVWDVELGTNMDWFISRITEEDSIIYFHNLKFDGVFIVDRIMKDGYEWVAENPRRGEFTTLITNTGAWYSMTVAWRNGKRTEFRDSHKKLPMSAARVAESFKFEENKLEIDYHAPRPIGHQLTMQERTYIAHDVLIIAKAMKIQLGQGMSKLTVGADALNEFKNVVGKKVFGKLFPILPETMDAEIRRALRGGWTYADTRFQGSIVGEGRTYDVNSLYPSVMYNQVLPYGEPVWCEGLPTPTREYPLYLVSITFTAKLKKDHVPCIQVKGSSRFVNTEYQTKIDDPVTLMVTNVDLALWEDHYDLDILSYNGGWLFKGVQGIFCEYIDKWMEIKMTSTGGLRELAKLMLNSLFGKFGTNPNKQGKVPILRDDTVEFEMGEPKTDNPIYTAMAVFITAYARDLTIRAAQQHYPWFAYADTDSLHLLIDHDPPTLDIDPHKMGAWKREYVFQQALFVRAKTYTEVVDGEHVTHIAGLPVNIAQTMTFEHFKPGTKLGGKKVPKRVPGGVVLLETDFTMPAE